MPYDSISELPDHVKANTSKACLRVYRSAYNDIEEREGGADESEKHKKASGAMQRVCSKNSNEKWTKDPEHTDDAKEEQNAGREQLAGGLATSADGSDDGPFTPEIVPIGEGDTTTGLSDEETYWGRDALREATERGVFDNAKLLKGRPETGHKPSVDSLAGPEEIVGDAGTFHYEEGRGPVSDEDGKVLDEHLAELIEHDLVEISPDMTRVLGDHSEELGAKPVERIDSVPYMTILDRGAGERASIGPARAEALGFNPDAAPGSDTPNESTSDEPAESGTDPATDTSTMSDTDIEDIEDLEEQLAAARQEVEQKEAQIDDLEDEKETLESEVEQKEERIGSLEDDTEHTRRRYALEATNGNEQAAEGLVSNQDLGLEDLAEMVVEDDEDESGDEDQLSPIEKAEEQLAQPPASRGGRGEDEAGGGGGASEYSEEQLAQANDLAQTVLSLDDVQRLSSEGISRREYLKREEGVDPAEYNTEDSLRTAIAEGGS